MENQKILEKLNEIFRDIFDDETLVIGRDTTSEDVEEWDSLTHITLIATVEKEFRIKFTMEEVIGLKNVGEMLDLIAERAE